MKSAKRFSIDPAVISCDEDGEKVLLAVVDSECENEFYVALITGTEFTITR
ncbi:MAG: hypothetical protein HYX66_03085 [Ignavibacteria bacterium]|nr:hypothetical protein [Ignavibacteria bacterium]